MLATMSIFTMEIAVHFLQGLVCGLQALYYILAKQLVVKVISCCVC